MPRCLRFPSAAHTPLLIAMIASAATRAQGDPFDKYATRPDQWRPASPSAPGVDARGDLNLSIPVMTVPGHAGLDFEVALSYQAGVRYADRGSWVGTGWRFDPGSITRDVFGVLSTSGASANVDFAAPPTLQPDAYHLTLPGATATMVRHAGAPGTIRPIREDSSGFYLTEWRPWRIGARTEGPVVVAGQQTLVDNPGAPAQLRDDYRRFVITREDGSRYVFDSPTLATYYGINANLAGRSSEQYVAVWRLVAILGPDYRGPEVPTGTEEGAWVRLSYGDGVAVGSVISHVAQDPAARPDGADRQPLGQSMALMEVLTPTHRAVFATEPRGLENFSHWEQREAVTLHRRLASVTLFSRVSGETGRVVRRAVFEPAATGFPSPEPGEPRLALARVRFFGRGAAADGQPGPEAPGYWFDYYRMEDEGGDLGTSDDFGYYTTRPRTHGFNGDIDDGKAWSLRSIVYPTGGWDEFEYENDAIVQGSLTFGRYNAATGVWNSPFYMVGSNLTRQGGTRLLRARRYDGLTQSFGAPVGVVTTYAYGPGRLTAPPPLSWTLGYGLHRLFLPQERGRAAVYYDSVERQEQDGSRVITRYTTPATDLRVRTVETVVWDWPHQDGGPGGTGNPAGIRAMAVAQGNQDWAWGHAFEIEYRNPARATRRVTRTLALSGFEPQAPGAAPVLAVAWGTGVNARIEWSYGPRLLQEDERDISASGHTAGPTRVYAYHDQRGAGPSVPGTGTGQLASVTEVREDGRRRRTEFAYGPDVYADLVDANRLTPVVREDLVELDASGTPVAWHRASVTRWRSVRGVNPGQAPFTSPTFFLPHEEWAWVAAGPATARPGFSAWTGGGPGPAWQRQHSFDAYDEGARATRILDARGHASSLIYDRAGRVLSASRETGSGVLLAASFAYDPHFGALSMVVDENGGRSTYAFDDLGRLTEVRDRSGAARATYAYATPREAGGRVGLTRPDRATMTQWTGGLPDRNVTVQFYDGLARVVQTQTLDDDGQYIVNATRYRDPVGASRSEQVRVPIRLPTGGEYAAGIVWQGPTALGAFVEDEPPTQPSTVQNYTETRYVRDGTGRVQGRTFPNAGGAPIPQTFHWYEAVLANGLGYRLSSESDESSDRVDTWTNAWGDAVRTLRRPTASTLLTGLVTEVDYDAAGNAVVVRPPNYFDPPHGTAAAWESRMWYDTRGRLTRRATPDAGEERFAYDPAGNVRFRQDANLRAAGQFIASRYDALGRLTRAGTYPLAMAGVSDFGGLDASMGYAAAAWENDDSRWTEAAAYDAKPATSTEPWSQFSAQVGAFTASYPRGRAVAAAARSGGAWQLELTGYDVEARVARRLVHTQDAGGAPAVAAYDSEQLLGYDRQGRLLTRQARMGQSGAWFRHWYQYGTRGLTAGIYAGTSATRPAVPDVAFTHLESGAPATVRYGVAPAMALAYDVRDRLVRSGGGVAGSPAHAFQAEYVYTPDGDVAQSAFYQRRPDGPETRDYWAYCYDDLDRLRFAARVEGGLPDPAQQCDELWGVTPDTPYSVADLAYDPNGNLRTLTRFDGSGAVVDRLTYSYGAGTNRIDQITDAAAGGGAAWDVETGPVLHDANGNVTRLPAPYLMTTAAYDERNRLQAATAGGRTVSYRYGPSGARIMQRLGATVSADGLTPVDPAGRAAAGAMARHPAAAARARAGGEVATRDPQRPVPETRRYAPRFGVPADTIRRPAPVAGGAGAPADAVTLTVVDAAGSAAPVAVRDPSGGVTYSLLTPGGEVVGRQPPAGGRQYDLRDALGSIRAVVDAAGGVVESRAYDAWGLALAGRTSAAVSTARGFTGKERDAAVGGPLGGLDDFGARTYAPLLGRFLQPDPAGAEFPDWSPYVYTLNRPLSLIDPDGRAPRPADVVYASVDDEWRVNRQTGEIERVGSRGGDQIDYYAIGVERGGEFHVEKEIVVDRDRGNLNMFRITYGADHTISTFHSPGSQLRGFMLEPGGPATTEPNRDLRIPAGSYRVTEYGSLRFPGHVVLSNGHVAVERRILIHAGNDPNDTVGCLLPGRGMGEGRVTDSRAMLSEVLLHYKRNQGAGLNIFETASSGVKSL